MKTLTKRLLSLAMAIVMVVALLPMNALPAQAEGTLTVSAYPAKVAVGQTSQLTVKLGEEVLLGKVDGEDVFAEGLTFESSNDKVATVVDGVVTGVHSGTAKITVKHGESDVGYIDVEVSATSTYDLTLNAFNIGNDTDGDGKADKFANKDSAEYDSGYIPANKYNTWTDVNAEYHLPYYATTTGDAYAPNHPSSSTTFNSVWYRGRTDVAQWYLYMVRFADAVYDTENSKPIYDYINLNNSAPWGWHPGVLESHGSIAKDSTYVTLSSTQLRLQAVTLTENDNGNEPYGVVVLDVPSAGNYNVDVTLSEKGAHNLHFYMMPTGVVNTNVSSAELRNQLTNPLCEIGTIDSAVATANSNSFAFTANVKGTYYFVVKADNDGTNKTINTAQWIKISSISMTVEEWSEPSLTTENNILLPGEKANVSVSCSSNLGNKQTLTDVTYTVSDNGTVLNVQTKDDGTLDVTGLAEGTSTITASYTYNGVPCSEQVTIYVTAGKELYINLSSKAFNWRDTSGETPVYPSWTDQNATDFLYYDTTASKANAGGGWDRGATGFFYYLMRNSNYKNLNPTYQNLEKTHPWTFTSYFSGLNTASSSGSYMNSADAWGIYLLTTSATPYFTLKFEVPNSGNYNVAVNVGVTGTHAHEYYMIPADSVSTIDATVLANYKSVGSLDATTTLTTSFMAELKAGTYYFVCKMSGTAGNTKLRSITLTPDIPGSTELSVSESNNMILGTQSTIKVYQNSTFSKYDITNATYVSDTPSVIHVSSDKGVATVTALGEGTARVTVTYKDMFGITRTATVSYTVAKPKELYINLSSTAFNWRDTSGETPVYPSWTDQGATDFLYYDAAASQINAGGGWDRGSVGFFYYLMRNSNYKNLNPTYQNLEKTHPWTFTSYFSGLNTASSSGSYMNSTAAWGIYLLTTSATPYFTLKFDVPNSGKYNIAVNAGVNGTHTHEYYMIPADSVSTIDATVLAGYNPIGSLDPTTTTLATSFEAELEAGTYYFVCKMSGTAGNTKLRSITLTPIVEEVDYLGDKIEQQAVIGDNFKMYFKVTPSGSLIKGYKLYLEDQEITTVDVQTGVLSEFYVSLAANQMSRKIKLQAVDANGNPVGEAREYSLGEYLQYLINYKEGDLIDSGKLTEETKTFAKYIYNYCAKAQYLANKDTDRLVAVEIPKTTTPDAPSTEDPRTGSTTGIKASSASLLLDNMLTLRFYFTLDEGKTMDDFKFAYGEHTGEIVTGTENGKCFVDIKGINPQAYNSGYALTVTDQNGDGSLTVKYTPMDYIEKKFASEKEGSALKNLVQALYDYHNAACDYLDN